MKIKRIICFLIIIYVILASNNICKASHRSDCSFCSANVKGYTATHITRIVLDVGDPYKVDFGSAILNGRDIHEKFYYTASRAGVIKYQDQRTGRSGFISNIEGTKKEIEGWNSDGKLQIQALAEGDIIIFYENENMAGKQLYGYHIIVKNYDDKTDDTNTTIMDDVTKNISNYKPKDSDMDDTSANKIESVTSKVLTAVSNVGIGVSVLVLAILGIKYMLGSVEEKAEYRQDLMPYLIGAMILFGITSFVKVLMIIGDKLNN